jgi:hypothetical protein
MSATISASAAIVASSVAANNAEMRKQHCETLVKVFDNSNTTVEQAREYSECVLWLYPTKQEVQYDTQLLVVSIVLAIILGGITSFIKGDDFWLEWFMFSCLYWVGLLLGTGFYWLCKTAFGV